MSGVIGGLPQYEPRVRQQVVGPPGQVNVGDGGAGGLFAISRSLQNVSGMFEQQADQYQSDRGREAGQNVAIDRDPATGLPVAPTLRRDTTPFARSFDAAARVAYLDTWKQTVTTEAVREAANHRNTPEAFLARMDQRIATMTESAPPEFRAELSREASSVVQGIGRQLLTGWANEQYRQAGQAFETQFSTYSEEVRLLLRNGASLNDPAVRAAMARVEEQATRGVMAGHLSPEQRDLRLQQVTAEGLVAQIAGEAGRRAQRDGVEAARAWARDALNDPRLAPAGDRVLSWARREIAAEIGEFRVEEAQRRQMVSSDWRTLEGNVRAGVNVPAEQFEAIARRAAAVGATDIAAEARAYGQVAPQIAALSRAPLDEIVQAHLEARNGNPNDMATGMLARATSQMIRERERALEQDPAGFAAQHPTVARARQQAALGQATMRDVVAASDAVQAQNGVPEAMRRVLPQSEVERVKAIVERGDNGATREALQSLFTTYGPEMRWRVWNDLRAGGIPASVRPAMLLMATGQQGALTTYLGARQMGEEALRRGAGNEADRIRDVMASDSTLTDLRSTRSGFAMDAPLMADVDEAVRTLALWHAGGGMSARDAVRAAVEQVVRPLGQVVTDSGAAFRIPSGTPVNPQEFRALLYQAASPTSLSRLRFSEENLRSAGISPDLTLDQQHEQMRRALRNGTWRTNQDGQGVWLHDPMGRPVFTEDGRPVEIRFEEARGATVGNLRAFQPRGIRNNNPLNIESGRFTQGQAGYVGSDGRFARFSSMEDGIAAADALLQRYSDMGLATPTAIISRWAPSSDGNNVPAYARRVATAMGIGVDDRIDMRDPAARRRLIEAMAVVENGQPLPGPARVASRE